MASLLLVSSAVLAGALIIVWPSWYLATRNRTVFNLLIGAILIAAASVLLARRLHRGRGKARRKSPI